MKFFSVEGANKIIPQLEEFVQRLRDLKDKILQKQVQIDTLLIVGGVSDPNAYSPSQNAVQKDVQELNEMVLAFNGLVEEINELGCQLKDPDLGLVDFFHIRDDKIVNLCWKSGESKIEFWHDLESGFPGRKKL
jgi:hypothetical protein